MIIFCRRIPSLLMTVCHPPRINWSGFDFFYIFVYPKSRTRWREYTVIVSSTGLRLKTTCSALQVGLGGNSLGVILDESLSIINNQYMGAWCHVFLHLTMFAGILIDIQLAAVVVYVNVPKSWQTVSAF